jgi:hypothetical protein
VSLDLGDAGHDAIRSIPEDLKETNPERRGDMTWRDGRWLDVEELHRPKGL